MVTGINHITFAVSDVARSFDFYVGTLGFRPIARWPDGAYLTVGEMWIAIVADDGGDAKQHAGYSHIALTCTADEFPAKRQALVRAGCAEWSANRSEGDSYYFCDPDGHRLEIHVGDLATRLRSMKAAPWAEFEFFPDAERIVGEVD